MPSKTVHTPGDPLPDPEPVAAEPAAEPEAPAAQAAPSLPDEADVDAAAIERPVLTRRGWVVPSRAIR